MKAPGVGVAAIVVDGARVLLVQRGRAPARGLWAFPGGRVQLGESLAAAVRREVREECGLDIEVVAFVDVVEAVGEEADGRYHWVILEYVARVTGGWLQVGDDAAAAAWYSLAEIAALATPPRVAELAARAIERVWHD